MLIQKVTASKCNDEAWLQLLAWSHLKFSGVDPVIALDERITQIVDAELLQTLQCLIAEI